MVKLFRDLKSLCLRCGLGIILGVIFVLPFVIPLIGHPLSHPEDDMGSWWAALQGGQRGGGKKGFSKLELVYFWGFGVLGFWSSLFTMRPIAIGVMRWRSRARYICKDRSRSWRSLRVHTRHGHSLDSLIWKKGIFSACRPLNFIN